MREPPTHEVPLPRTKLAVWERGSGDPVLLLHGFPDHAVGLLPLADAVAGAGFRALVPALPGYWPSSPVNEGGYSIEEVTGDILSLLDEMDVETVRVIGHDWGAEVAYRMGSRNVDRITSLLCLAAPHPAGYAVRRTVFAEQQTAWYAIFLGYAPAAPRVAASAKWLTGLARSWSPDFHRDDWPEIVELLRRPGVIEAVCGYYRADLDASLDPEPVRVPTTIVYGGQDGCLGPILFDGLDPWFEAGLDLRLVPHVGHWPHLEDPDVVPVIVGALGGSG